MGIARSSLRRQKIAVGIAVVAKAAVLVSGLWRAHPFAALAVFFGSDLWVLHGLFYPNATTLMPVLTEFFTPRREVWLTIDDGPEPATTPAMLDLLDRYSARATFFLIGTKVAMHPALVRDILGRGHGVGNHTHTHPLATFWYAGRRRTEAEIEGCNRALMAAGAAQPAWFRCPAGIKTLSLHGALRRNEQQLVGWSRRALEQFSLTPVRPLQRLISGLRPGAILLLHESAPHAARRIALLSGLLTHLAASDYRCVLPEKSDLR